MTGAGGAGQRPVLSRRSDLAALDLLAQPIWILDLDRDRIWWANRSALGLWHAESLDELLARDLSADSPAVKLRMRELREALPPTAAVEESWTIYPKGRPVRVQARMTPVDLEPGGAGVLVEASRVAADADPDHARLAEATRYTPLIVSTIAPDGRILAQNPAAVHAYGGTGGADDEPGAWQRRFIDRAEGDRVIARCLAEGRIEDNLQVLTGDGIRWHRLDACRGRDPVTGDACVVVTESDISDRIEARRALELMRDELEQEVRRRTRELEQAKQEAEAASMAKSGFLANVSHELRTPLNAIMGFAELLQEPKIIAANPGRLREYSESILLSARLLLNLIDDILDLSRIEAKRVELQIEPVALAEVMAECETIAAPLALNGAITLDISRPSPDLRVMCDQRALTQVILNLASNSLKFTPEGGTVRITTRPADGTVQVVVEDTGVGIAAADLPHVIEPFAQAANPLVRRAKGHGLGLPIAKQLVELMGGRFEIASALGRGTTVTLTLPAPDDR